MYGELLDDRNFAVNNKEEELNICPVIQAYINNTMIRVLIDSGSVVTCIRESTYHQVVENSTDRIEMIPIPRIQLITATGSRTTHVKKKIAVELDMQGHKLQTIMLVVPKLQFEVILGIDWLIQHRCKLNFVEHNISFINENHEVSKVIKYGREDTINVLSTCSIKYEEKDVFQDNIKDKLNQYLKENSGGIHSNYFKDLSMILNKYADVFSDKPGLVKVYQHEIRMKDRRNITGKVYPIPHSKLHDVDRCIQEMLQDGIIEECISEHVNPLVVVQKSDGSIRLCLDARNLNRQMCDDQQRAENIEELLTRFEKKKCFTMMDLTASYWQIPLRKEDRPLTAFVHRGQTYAFTRIPFGLKCSMSGLMRAVNKVLGPEVRDYTIIYVDDIILASETYEEHLQHLEIVLSKLMNAGFTIKLSKCQFMKNEIQFLGHTISARGIRPAQDRIEKIFKLHKPRNVKELKHVIGVCNFYRRFVMKYSSLIEPFRNLLKAKQRWKWEEHHDRAFEDLKQAFYNCIILKHPTSTGHLKVFTDASINGICGWVTQDNGQEDLDIISIVSRGLTTYEKRYTVTELELLAIVFTLDRCKAYLLGRPFTILTDHHACAFIKTCKLNSNRISRWILALQMFNFKIEHISGKTNILADYGSRYPAELENCEQHDQMANEEDIFICKLGIKIDDTAMECKKLLHFRREQQEDEQLKVIFEGIMKDIQRRCKEKRKELVDRGEMNEDIMEEGRDGTDIEEAYSTEEEIRNILSEEEIRRIVTCFKRKEYRLRCGFIEVKNDDNWSILVPKSLQKDVIWLYHKSLGHAGSKKVLEAVLEDFSWRNVAREIRKEISTCQVCQETKFPKQYLHGKYNAIIPSRPNQIVSCDIMGPLIASYYNYKYIIAFLDVFSKYVTLVPLRNVNGRSCVNALVNRYLKEHPVPESIITDNGTYFWSRTWMNKLKELRIKALHTSIRMPSSNNIERTFRDVNRMLRVYVSENHVRWAKYLDHIAECINVSYHESINSTPYEIVFRKLPNRKLCQILGLEPKEIQDIDNKIVRVYQHLKKKAISRGNRHDRKVKITTFQRLDQVMLRRYINKFDVTKFCKKLFRVFVGPFTIKERKGNNAYLLMDEKGKEIGIYNVIHLKPFIKAT